MKIELELEHTDNIFLTMEGITATDPKTGEKLGEIRPVVPAGLYIISEKTKNII